MSKTCAIMQPTYIPWIGYFDLIDQVDVFVFLDNVQLVKRSWQVRNRIKTPNGELFLTIPIKKNNSRDETSLNSAVVNDDENWRLKHLKSIELNYKKSKYFTGVYDFIVSVIDNNECILADFNINIIKKICELCNVKSVFIRASGLREFTSSKDELLVEICNEIDCKDYISPQGSSEYIEACNPGGAFTKNDIKLYYHNFEHPLYSQKFGNFLSFMSIIDLLFNVGFTDSIDIIRLGRKRPFFYKEFRAKVSGL